MASFTHVGSKPNVAYVHTGRNFGHTLPRPGKSHALNATGRGDYLALCGEKIRERYTDDWTGDPIIDHVSPTSVDGVRITCERCRRALMSPHAGGMKG